METVQLQGNIPFEKYEMAINLLRDIGLEVKINEPQEQEKLPAEVIENIEKGWQELRAGKGIKREDVQKKAEEICNGK